MPVPRDFWKLWSASAASNLGDGISLIAFPWLASAITREPLEIAFIGIMSRLPWLLFTIPAGVITDRVDRRRLIVWMDVLRALVTLLLGLVILFGPPLPDPADLLNGSAMVVPGKAGFYTLLCFTALAFGMMEVLRDNAAQTLLPSIVKPDQLETANGRLWGIEMTMNSFAGPPMAGFLIAIGLSVPFFVDAGTLLLAALLMLTLRGDFGVARTSQPAARRNWRKDAAEGVRYLWANLLLRRLAICLGILNGMMMMALATFVLFAQEILLLSPKEYGLLMTSAAAGGILGGVIGGRVTRILGAGPTLALTVVISVVEYGAIGLSSDVQVIWVMMMAGSFVGMLWNIVTVSLRQRIIPDRLLGRVNSVYRMFGWGMMPVGMAIGGGLVAFSELFVARESALRVPFLVAAVVFAGLFFYVIRYLTSASIRDAQKDT